ncbi:MAG: DUF3291 domain-containing protein [Paracoccus sp. (in: a-proteobacteria)]|uniref:DUF3291 domain-containing protein n=1 Tax=Paracoccus sp. TaxID=267 RepID=UPI004058BC7C
MRPGHHLAELNVGRLLAPTDDPRVAEFMGALDRINGLGKRMPGFVWMMEGSGEPGTGNTENSIGDDPQSVANLTVWESVETLEHFVWNTVHRQFYERRQEWFEVLGRMHFVMWWVPEGHRPTLDEALERLEMLRRDGASEDAFDWRWLKEARLWKERSCGVAAE